MFFTKVAKMGFRRMKDFCICIICEVVYSALYKKWRRLLSTAKILEINAKDDVLKMRYHELIVWQDRRDC